jgi:hypothetical protein
MRHNIGGCCDCGDEKTIDPKGACDNHRGFDKVDIKHELSKIPEHLRSKVESFLQAVILCYSKLVTLANLDYNVWVWKCRELVNLFNINDDDLKQMLSNIDEDDAKAKQHEQGAYLYNLCFTFLFWMVD